METSSKLSLVFSFLRSLGFKSLPCTWFTTTDILRKLLSWVGLFQTDDSSNSASLEMDLATLSVTKVSFTPHLPGDFRGVTNVGWAGINQKDQSKGGSTIVPATCLRKMDMPGPRNWSLLGKEVLTSTTGCASLDLSSPTWESLWPPSPESLTAALAPTLSPELDSVVHFSVVLFFLYFHTCFY